MISDEIVRKFPTWILFPDCPKDMQGEFIDGLIHQQMFLNQYKDRTLALEKEVELEV